MKKLMMVAMCVCVTSLAVAQGRLLKRVAQQADKVSAAYEETWNSFYGVGHYKNLMKASLDVRPDGTPNIVLDESAEKMDVTIRLSVNESNYEAWKKKTHDRFTAANMSFEFSDFEDTEGRMIGGKNYKFGDNEEQAIKRWEEKEDNQAKANLTVRIRIVDRQGKTIRDSFVPLEKFKRIGFISYPIPLHNLNRLMELPRSRFHWFSTDKEPQADSHVEDGYTKISYTNVSKEEQEAFDRIECDILDDEDMKPIREAERNLILKKHEAELNAAMMNIESAKEDLESAKRDMKQVEENNRQYEIERKKLVDLVYQKKITKDEYLTRVKEVHEKYRNDPKKVSEIRSRIEGKRKVYTQAVEAMEELKRSIGLSDE